MADATSAALAAMFGGGGGGSDLDIFARDLQANDMWSLASQPILGARFDTSTWSPGETAAVTAGQAFLGAMLNRYGQQQQAKQLSAVANILPKLYSDPSSVALPEGVDEGAFAGLQARAERSKYANDLKRSQEIQDLFTKAKAAGLTKMLEAEGEIAGKQKGYGTAGVTDPENPIEKKTVELRTDFDKRDEVKNYKYVQRLTNQLVETMKDPSAVPDPILAKMVVQFVEPQMAVNAGESAALAASSSIPQEWKGKLGQALEGKSVFDDDIRKSLLGIASAAYKAHSGLYQKTFDTFAADAARYKIPTDRIAPLGAPVTFEQLTGGVMRNLDLAALAKQFPNTPEGLAAFKKAAGGG